LRGVFCDRVETPDLGLDNEDGKGRRGSWLDKKTRNARGLKTQIVATKTSPNEATRP